MRFVLLLLSFFVISNLACTDFQLKPADGSVICARAMGFLMPMDSKILVFNRDENRVSTAPNSSKGLEWTSIYGIIGINAFNINNVDEGMNEKGLTCGFLVLESTQYPIIKNENNISIAIIDVCTWILGMFSTTEEVKVGIGKVRIWGNVLPKINEVLGLHIAVHDALGNNLVIEFIDGSITLNDNHIGVLTNDPIYPYQLFNLALYNDLSPYIPPNATINGYKIKSIPGIVMRGMPGSWSSMDRFVRVANLVRYILTPKTALEGVLSASHILNSVYVPMGIVTFPFKNTIAYDSTRWESIKDLTNKIFYFRNSDGAIRSIYLQKLNFAPGTKHDTLTVRQPYPLITDVTGKLN